MFGREDVEFAKKGLLRFAESAATSLDALPIMKEGVS